MALDQDLLHILVCPVCRNGLDVMGETEGLACTRCAVVYPIRDEIPVMLAEEAVPAREWAAGKRQAFASPPKNS